MQTGADIPAASEASGEPITQTVTAAAVVAEVPVTPAVTPTEIATVLAEAAVTPAVTPTEATAIPAEATVAPAVTPGTAAGFRAGKPAAGSSDRIKVEQAGRHSRHRKAFTSLVVLRAKLTRGEIRGTPFFPGVVRAAAETPNSISMAVATEEKETNPTGTFIRITQSYHIYRYCACSSLLQARYIR